MNESSQNYANSALALIESEMFRGEYAEIKEIIDNDPVEIEIASKDEQILPPQFLDLARKLHHNYLYWQHSRDREQTTQLTFYRHTQEGITQAAEKVAAAGTPIEPEILLLLETRITLITINSLLLATEDYLKESHLQDAKESVDTALSTLYEFIKTREQLEPSLEAAIASIQQEIATEPESQQYASYLATQIVRLQDSSLVREPKLYVVRNQLEKLGETLILLIPGDSHTPQSPSKTKQDIDVLMTRLLFAMVDEEAYITTIRHEDSIKNVSFSPDSNYLATASQDNTAKLVEVATGNEIATITHGDSVKNVSFSPDSNYLATASQDNTAKLVEVATGNEIATIAHRNSIAIAHRDSIKNVSFSPDSNYLATASWDNTVKLVKVATGSEIATIAHKYEVSNLSFSLDSNYLATASQDNTAKLVEVATGSEIAIIANKYSTENILFSPNSNYLVTASRDNTTKLVEIATSSEVATIAHGKHIQNILFSPNSNYLAIVSQDNTAKLVKVATGSEITTITHGKHIQNILFSPNSNYLATASRDNTIKLVEVATGSEIATITHRGSIKNISFSPNSNYLATTSWDNTAKLVKVIMGREIATIPHEDSVIDVLFSPDSNYLVIRGYKISKLVKVATGKEVTSLSCVRSANTILFSRNGAYLVTIVSKSIKLVDVKTGKEISSIAHSDEINGIAFSPDSAYLATVSKDKTTKLINLGKLAKLINEEKDYSVPQQQVSSIVHVDKPEAFFLGWLRIESNRYSFYEYMLAQADKEQEGLSVRYRLPILETNILLESLGFLLLNAEKHYQRVYPTLIGINETKISIIAMQDMKQSIAAGLASLHEFLHHRMELDGEEYSQAIERFKREVEEKVDNSDLLLKIQSKLQFILQFEGIQNRGELQTIKEMLEAMEKIFKQVLPTKPSLEKTIKAETLFGENVGQKEIANALKEFKIEGDDLTLLISRLSDLGIVNYSIVSLAIKTAKSQDIVKLCQSLPQESINVDTARQAIFKVKSQDIVKLCQSLPQESIDKYLALQVIKKRRKTHYIGTLSPFTNISRKEILLKILKSAPKKSWWRR